MTIPDAAQERLFCPRQSLHPTKLEQREAIYDYKIPPLIHCS
jgi:hypothetical protein